MATNVFKPRRGSKSKLAVVNPILEDGELCIEYPDGTRGPGGVIKIGDGITHYNDLPTFLDKGDFIDKKMIGAAMGVAPLNSAGVVDKQYVSKDLDNIEIYSRKEDFPTLGKINKLYICTSESLDNLYRFNADDDKYEKVSKSITYTLEKEGSSVVLKGTDGSKCPIDNVGGVEIRDTNPSPSELYPGKMWILRT